VYRRVRYGYAFRRIPLSRGKYAIVDPDDYQRLSQHKWCADRALNTFYAKRNRRCRKSGKIIRISMHRQIMKAPAGFVVDHINYNGLDNRKANLRLANHSQNVCHRRKLNKSSSSRYKGIYFNKQIRKWRAQIHVNRKFKQIGYFKDEIEAAKAYDRAAKKYHGEFASLNFRESR
jgi:hypothetical protein